MKAQKLQRAADSTTITVSLKKSFRDRIDAAAAAEQRSRSNYIVKVLTEAVAAAQGGSPTSHPCPASGCGEKKTKIA